MNEQEWLDKQNGTRNALQGPSMSDTDRNIMRGLQHEGCEAHCEECGACITDMMAEYDEDAPLCDDCLEDIAADAHAEAMREARDEASEARFNARWPR